MLLLLTCSAVASGQGRGRCGSPLALLLPPPPAWPRGWGWRWRTPPAPPPPHRWRRSSLRCRPASSWAWDSRHISWYNKKKYISEMPTSNRYKKIRQNKECGSERHVSRSWVKGTVSRDRLNKFWHQFKEIGLTKGRGWILNFLGAPMVLHV